MSQPNNGAGFTGFQTPSSGGSEFNAQSFLIWSILSRIHTAVLVQVQSVTNAGGVAAVGMVNIVPLVAQVDGNGNQVPHGTIYQCPYFRLQGGANAIILDPQADDIGIAIFAERDISSVIANKGNIQASPVFEGGPFPNPGSRRTFDMADALYIGGVLNGIPTQFLQFSSSGVTITSPYEVTINAPTAVVNAATAMAITAPTLTINSDVTVNGNFGSTGTMQNNGKNIGSAHEHSGVQTGSGNTGGPI